MNNVAVELIAQATNPTEIALKQVATDTGKPLIQSLQSPEHQDLQQQDTFTAGNPRFMSFLDLPTQQTTPTNASGQGGTSDSGKNFSDAEIFKAGQMIRDNTTTLKG